MKRLLILILIAIILTTGCLGGQITPNTLDKKPTIDHHFPPTPPEDYSGYITPSPTNPLTESTAVEQK
jgi:hypothetical protein